MPKTIYTEIYNPNGNFLFTLEQLNNAKTNDKCLPVRCLQCGKIFYIRRKDYVVLLKHYTEHLKIDKVHKYCSRECSRQYERDHSTITMVPCLFCGKLVAKSACELRKHPNTFCCHSHAAKYNNTQRAPRSKESRLKTSKSVSKTRLSKHIPPHSNDNHTCRFKRGWHTTWNNKQVYYRSNYELDYCKLLDEQCVDYDMEAVAIEYYDTQLEQTRTALPDFLIPQSNTLVEIKSLYTYDKQNMIDRSEQYKKLGYNFKLILEHQEYDYCP